MLSARSKLLRAPAVVLLRQQHAPAQVGGQRLVGLLGLELVDGRQRLGRTPCARRCALISARSAVVPLSGRGDVLQLVDGRVGLAAGQVGDGQRGALSGVVRVELQCLGEVFLGLLGVAVLQVHLAGQACTAPGACRPCRWRHSARSGPWPAGPSAGRSRSTGAAPAAVRAPAAAPWSDRSRAWATAPSCNSTAPASCSTRGLFGACCNNCCASSRAALKSFFW